MTKDEMIQAVMDEFELDREMAACMFVLQECDNLAKLGLLKRHGEGSMFTGKGQEYLQRLKQVGYEPTMKEIIAAIQDLRQAGIFK